MDKFKVTNGCTYLYNIKLKCAKCHQQFLIKCQFFPHFLQQIASLDELFEWLVPPILVQVKKSELFVPYSELHLFTCMIRLFAEILNLDELVNTVAAAYLDHG